MSDVCPHCAEPLGPTSDLVTVREETLHMRCYLARDNGEPSKGTQQQPPPKPNAHPAVWDLVLADMRARDAMGAKQYGVRLQPHNGRDALLDAYHEVLDAAVYLRQALFERDGQ